MLGLLGFAISLGLLKNDNEGRPIMYNHMPDNYVCPFCLVSQGIENEHVYTKQDDIIYQDFFITAFISAGCWKNNKGHVLIIPNQHYENLYDLPDYLSAKIHDFEKDVALALKKVYKCDGVSSRQHNEPCGYQDVWHYHLHVFPRYKNDNLYKTDREDLPPHERAVYAKKLREYFQNNKRPKKASHLFGASEVYMSDKENTMVWGEDDINVFLSYGNVFIPDRARLNQRICSLLPKADSPMTIVDICCGDGQLSYEIAKKSPHYEIYFCDATPALLENAKSLMKKLPNKVHYQDFDLLNYEKNNFPANCDGVVSTFAIHHLSDGRKESFFRYIYDMLPKHGVFVIADNINPVCKDAEQVAAADWEVSAYKQSIDFTGSLNAYQSFRDSGWNIYSYDYEEDICGRPASLYDQLKMLDTAGFSKVDVLWIYAGHAIFYGIK